MTVQYHFYLMPDSGVLDAVNAILVAGVRVAEGRETELTAGIINSQLVKTTKVGGNCSRRWQERVAVSAAI